MADILNKEKKSLATKRPQEDMETEAEEKGGEEGKGDKDDLPLEGSEQMDLETILSACNEIEKQMKEGKKLTSDDKEGEE